MAVILESCRILILKMALKAGSSKHMNAFRASTKHVNDAKTHFWELKRKHRIIQAKCQTLRLSYVIPFSVYKYEVL